MSRHCPVSAARRRSEHSRLRESEQSPDTFCTLVEEAGGFAHDEFDFGSLIERDVHQPLGILGRLIDERCAQ